MYEYISAQKCVIQRTRVIPLAQQTLIDEIGDWCPSSTEQCVYRDAAFGATTHRCWDGILIVELYAERIECFGTYDFQYAIYDNNCCSGNTLRTTTTTTTTTQSPRATNYNDKYCLVMGSLTTELTQLSGDYNYGGVALDGNPFWLIYGNDGLFQYMLAFLVDAFFPDGNWSIWERTKWDTALVCIDTPNPLRPEQCQVWGLWKYNNGQIPAQYEEIYDENTRNAAGWSLTACGNEHSN